MSWIDREKVVVSVSNPGIRVDDAETEENEVYAIDIVIVHSRWQRFSFFLSLLLFLFFCFQRNWNSIFHSIPSLVTNCHDLLHPYLILHENPSNQLIKLYPINNPIIRAFMSFFVGQEFNFYPWCSYFTVRIKLMVVLMSNGSDWITSHTVLRVVTN